MEETDVSDGPLADWGWLHDCVLTPTHHSALQDGRIIQKKRDGAICSGVLIGNVETEFLRLLHHKTVGG
ncbi:MAG: hypothetical protein J6Y79_03100, partial [Paludibacteraceae bacterium]|nr:hypothetical protein [Paludibacteraceae bacterium]